jgi:hypothetical protein
MSLAAVVPVIDAGADVDARAATDANIRIDENFHVTSLLVCC